METRTPVQALQSAIAGFPTKAGFRKSLSAAVGKPISNARIQNWLLRDKKVPAEICPHVEQISGIPCEALNTDMDWKLIHALLRARRRPTTTRKQSA